LISFDVPAPVSFRLRPFTTVAAIAAFIILTAVPARAQIFSWRDAQGHLVLSDRALGAVEHTYAVPQTDAIRTTRPTPPSRSKDYDDLIAEYAGKSDVRSDLVRAVVQVESAFNPYARSPKGALGLMQLMPATMQRFGVRNPFDPADNVRAGVAYLRELLDRYDDDEQLALAAYNAGPGAVDRHGQTIPPYRETRNYVSKITGMTAPATPRPQARQIYKITEIVDGRAIIKFTDRRPSSGSFEVVGR
jgi:soluble lytic murein transglycosylase-like protein